MFMYNAFVNKTLYKIFLGIIKIVPNILAMCKISSLILNYLKIPSFVLTCVGGTSIITLVLLYLISYIFKFCGTHRVSLHYVLFLHLLTVVDYYIGIPIDLKDLYYLYTIITGVFMTAWIYFWYKNKNNPKIDHIKQLCDKYADCGC